MNRRLIDGAFESTLSTLGALNLDLENLGSKGRVSVDVQPSEDNEWLHVTFSRQADFLFQCDGVQPFLERQGIDQGAQRLDVTVALRVRRQDLIDGHPEKFDLIQGARLEIRPRDHLQI